MAIRLLKKLLLFLVPFALALGMFVLFEPYDYFGLRGDATYLSRPLSSERLLLREQPKNLIFGDSRMANLNLDYVEELAGERWESLAFGGANLGESIELFWFAAERTELEKVVFGVSYYGSLGEQIPGRTPGTIELADNPLKFITRFNHWLEAMASAKQKAFNLVYGLLGREELKEYPEDPTLFNGPMPPAERGERYRANLEEYVGTIEMMIGSRRLEPETLQKLCEIADYCEQNGIELCFVFPPMHQIIFELCDRLDLDGDRELYKATLRERARVLDMEFENDFTADENNFYDGFHLVSEQKKLLARLIFTDLESDYIIRTEKE